MLTKDKPRIILIVAFLVLAIGAFVIPMRLFEVGLALPISQIAIGTLMSLMPLVDYALNRRIATANENQAAVSGLPMRVAVGLGFVCIGLAKLTGLGDIFIPMSCVVMLIGILLGFYITARFKLRTNPPPAGAGMLARMGLTGWEAALIVIFILGIVYVLIFGLPRSIGWNPEEVNP